jgi:hypothetical protein
MQNGSQVNSRDSSGGINTVTSSAWLPGFRGSSSRPLRWHRPSWLLICANIA